MNTIEKLLSLYKEAYDIYKRNVNVQMPLADRLRLQEIECDLECLNESL